MPDIRRAALDDAAAMAAYMTALAHETLDTISPKQPVTQAQQRVFLEDFHKNPRAFMLLALAGDRVVGIVDVAAGMRDHARHAGKLGISVARDWRGRGVGRALLKAAIAEAKAWDGFCRIELDVVSWNPHAKALYESVGFVTEALKRKAVNFRGLPEDEYQMALVW